ncbi:MAG: BrnT family toxin [Magnetococcales bacterium]|nr:BrnT family toxin [Magnetococcales bacterium]
MRRQRNIDEYDIDLVAVFEFDFENSDTQIDNSQHYCQDRFIAYGNIGNRLHVLVYTVRDDGAFSVISLRKANKHEVEKHGL